MKILITMIEWEYPKVGTVIKPEVWDLSDKDTLWGLYLAFANGVILEVKAEGDSDEALEVLRGLIKGAGACVLVELSAEEKERLWLCEEGYECYKQGSTSPGYVFVNPVAQPTKF